MGIVCHAQSHPSREYAERYRTLQSRVLRHVRGYLRGAATHRSGWLDLVHWRGRLDVPADWDTYKIHYRYCETVSHITIKRSADKMRGVTRVSIGGTLNNELGVIPLVDDRQEHQIEVELGNTPS